MKRKQVIWKMISNTDLMISNTGLVAHKLGGLSMDIGGEWIWGKYFTESELEMIDDEEESLEEKIISNAISFDEFMRMKP